METFDTVATMTSSTHLEPGSMLGGDFRIVRPLSQGGMGAVYVVDQLSTGKQRALKVMLPQLAMDPKFRERFVMEARIGASINSDHIVEVVGAGIDSTSGTPWLAMELLEGKSLDDLVIERGKLQAAETLEIFEQLGDALIKAHTAGIVHRDLKPQNIFVATSRRRGVPFTVKLLDFGISSLLRENDTAVTATSTMGSPLWMAPEQVDKGRLRPATDVWALGLIAFYLLTGKFFWRAAESDHQGILTALLTEILMHPIPLASERAQAIGCAEALPSGFDGWFKRCVARNAEDRFRDAEQLLVALRPVLTATPTVQIPNAVPLEVRAVKVRTRSNPWPYAAGLTLILGVSTVAWLAGRGSRAVPPQEPRTGQIAELPSPNPQSPPVPAVPSPPVQIDQPVHSAPSPSAQIDPSIHSLPSIPALSTATWSGAWHCRGPDEPVLTISGQGRSSQLSARYAHAFGGQSARETYEIESLDEHGAAGSYLYFDANPSAGYQGRPGVWDGRWRLRVSGRELLLHRADRASSWQGDFRCRREQR